MSRNHRESLLTTFYTTPRAAAPLLSDGGGPLGFDIHAALQMDYVIESYRVERIIETGCCLGDTTEYLARRYPRIRIWTCDVNRRYAAFASNRLCRYSNVTVVHGDSVALLPSAIGGDGVPLLYFDAHWGEHWPLAEELSTVDVGVAVIDDFDVGDPRFGFDSYNGVDCNIEMIARARPDARVAFTGNPFAKYRYPCLQVGRRAGKCYLPIGVDPGPFFDSTMFKEIKFPVPAEH